MLSDKSCDLCVGNCHLRRKVVVEKSECNAALAILHYTDYVLVKPSFLWLHSGTMANIVTKGSSINYVSIFQWVGRQHLCGATNKMSSSHNSSMRFVLNFGPNQAGNDGIRT